MTNLEHHSRRLSDILNALNLNQTELSKKAGIVQSHISAVIKEKKGISYGMIEKLMRHFPQVNVNRIFTGRGPVLLPDWEQYDQVGEPSVPYGSTDPLAQTWYHLVCALREVDRAIAKNCQTEDENKIRK